MTDFLCRVFWEVLLPMVLRRSGCISSQMVEMSWMDQVLGLWSTQIFLNSMNWNTPRNDQWARAIAGPWASSVPQRTSTCLISRAAECASVTVPYRPIINKKIWFYIIQILYNSFMGLTIWMDDRVPHKYLSHVKLFGINYAIIINWLFTYYTIRLISYKLTALVYISINQSHWASTYQAEIGL